MINLSQKKNIYIALTISICFLIIVLLYGKKSIENEEILGLRIGMNVSEALKKYPEFACNKKSGYTCSTIANGQALQIEVNADEIIYLIKSAVVVSDMSILEVVAAAKKEYSNANTVDGNDFYWNFDKAGNATKTITIRQNNLYSWFCLFDNDKMTIPDCKGNSIMIYKRLYDEQKFSIWFDKNSSELKKLRN